jgi:hypothetical protein
VTTKASRGTVRPPQEYKGKPMEAREHADDPRGRPAVFVSRHV